MTKTLIMIGGSELQIPSLRWAKEAGLRVVLTDQNPDAPGRRLADEFYPLGGHEIGRQVALARALADREPFAGAYCGNDFGLAAVAAIAEATGAPGPVGEAVALALDKTRSTARWRELGLSTTEGRAVRDEADVRRALDELGGPLILKPTDSSGSRGVRDIDHADQIPAALAEASRYSDGLLVERRLEGHHLDVNGYFRDGAFVPGGILDRIFDDRGHHIPVWGSQPASLDPTTEDGIFRLVEAAARALGIDVGPVKADLILTDRGPVIYELAPRFHGDVSTSHVSPIVYGKSPVQAWLAHLAEAGGPFDEMPLSPRSLGGWMAVLAPHTGELAAVEGRARALRRPGLVEVMLRRPGFRVTSVEDNRAVCGFLWAEGRTRSEVEQRLNSALETLDVKMTCPQAA